MRSVSDFDVTVDVTNPIEFCSDTFRNALLLVRETYQGRCFKGKFIVEVLEVVRTSKCLMCNVGSLGSGTMNVCFRALWSRRGPGDFVPLVRIGCIGEIVVGENISRQLGELSARPERQDVDPAPDDDGGGLTLNGEEPMTVSFLQPSELFVEGQAVPVRIAHVEYPPLGTPAATATLLTCRRSATVWKISGRGTIPATLIRTLATLLDLYGQAAHNAARSADGKALQGFFTSLLSPYRAKDMPLPPGFAAHEMSFPEGPSSVADQLSEIVSLCKPGTCWTRPLERPFGWTGLCSVSSADADKFANPDGAEDPDDRHYEVRSAPAPAVIATLALQMANELEMLAALSSHFKTLEDIKAQRGLWSLMQAAQR